MIQHLAHERDHGHDQFGHGKDEEQPTCREPVRERATHEAAEPHAEHEHGHNEGDRVQIETGNETDQSLPDHLIQQRNEAGSKEERKQDGENAPRRNQAVAGAHCASDYRAANDTDRIGSMPGRLDKGLPSVITQGGSDITRLNQAAI